MPAPHQKGKIHPEDQRNLILFAILFGIVYLLFDSFVLRPHIEKMDAYHNQVETKKAAVETGILPKPFVPREDALETSPRAVLNHSSITASIALTGGRLDDVRLNTYYETLAKKEHVAVMSPEKSEFPRYAEFGWLGAKGDTPNTPDKNSQWEIVLQNSEMTRLRWRAPNGLVFERDYKVSDDFLVTVTQRVINNSSADRILYPYALITEQGLPNQLINRWIIHEGPIGFIDESLQERDYSDMTDQPPENLESTTGWIGFTEQYWLTAILPEQKNKKTFRYAYKAPANEMAEKGLYQVDVMGEAETIPAGGQAEHTTHIFAGAKQFRTIETYQDELGVNGFDTSIDWGWFWFLTRPFFRVLHMINDVIGHFGTTMLVFALLLRLLIFPMANTSYRSFAKLRIITPRIMELKEQYSDDKVGMQKAMMELYKKEKVNPAAGCLPMLIQIPIFFSLFKVLNVSIEMRHAPGFFWIKDLSAPDPTSLFNLFGLLPYDVPSFLMIGAWPCIMVITLLLQRSMNPPPTDPVMRDMFRLMPYFMGFIMSGFAAGLVIYWTFSNFLSIVQQYTIMRMMGVKVKFFQGWFGREYQENKPDASRLGFSEDILNETPKQDVSAKSEDDESDVIKDITPPKPKRSKKKK